MINVVAGSAAVSVSTEALSGVSVAAEVKPHLHVHQLPPSQEWLSPKEQKQLQSYTS